MAEFSRWCLVLRNDPDFPEHLHIALAKQDYYFLPNIRFPHALKVWTNIAFPQFVSGQSITKIRIFARKEKESATVSFEMRFKLSFSIQLFNLIYINTTAIIFFTNSACF